MPPHTEGKRPTKLLKTGPALESPRVSGHDKETKQRANTSYTILGVGVPIISLTISFVFGWLGIRFSRSMVYGVGNGDEDRKMLSS